jgi:hypothetical protein
MKNIDFSSHYVNYKVTKLDLVLINLESSACFGDLFRLKFDKRNVIELSEFLRVDTKTYASDYIKIISKICGVKTFFKSEDCIVVEGFKNLFILKTFLTMYRLLFEANKNYGSSLNIEHVIKQRVLFFEALINKTEKCKYRCNFKKLIYFHNLYIKNTLGNSNHCLRSYSDMIVKSKAQLLNYKIDSHVHNFFMV